MHSPPRALIPSLSCAGLIALCARGAQAPPPATAVPQAAASSPAAPDGSTQPARTVDPWAPMRAALLGAPPARLQPAQVARAGALAVELGQFGPLADTWLAYFQRAYRPDVLSWPGTLAAISQWRLASLLGSEGSAALELPPALLRRFFCDLTVAWQLATTVKRQDNLPEVLQLLGEIERAFGPAAQQHFNLALALAVVWDQPPSEPYHGQVSASSLLPIRPDVEARFRFFAERDRAGRTAYPLRELDPGELIYVVDAPVPVSELEWADRNVRGRAVNWGGKFYDIEYAYRRVDQGLLSWNPELMYTLENIREFGGICVDQAYYATVTAKAKGIPAMYFNGTGRRGDHAWFGYMRRRGRWELDAGRYFQDNYVTGYSVDPQTRRRLSDHDIELLVGARIPERARDLANLHLFAAEQFARAARIDLAIDAAHTAMAAAPALLEPWQAAASYLAQLPNAAPRLIAHYDRMAAAFRDEADVQADIAQARADLARRYAGSEHADRLLERAAERQGRNRYDLALTLARERIRQLEAENRTDEVLELYRDTISEYRAERAAVLDLLAEGAAFLQRHGRAEEAVELVEWALRRIQPTWGDGDTTYTKAMTILASAHEANGDTREAERIRRRWLSTGTD